MRSFKPTLILHGGAGNIHRSTLPPPLYEQYHASLLTYLRSTKILLENGSSALDAAVHAVSLMEDDELFNCGRGSVFTTAGTIEMEASVMVTSVSSPGGNCSPRSVDKGEQERGQDDGKEGREEEDGSTKRGAGVIGLKNVRHPIQLAKEVLFRTGQGNGNGNGNGNGHGDTGGGNMHCQLSGEYVESLARDWGLEFKPDDWFWTKRRWEEHRRGLAPGTTGTGTVSFPRPTLDHNTADGGLDGIEGRGEMVALSQGTVGCVCLDQWGNLAVATSTGGMTNKAPGRVGDTPTLGAGFWAESWSSLSSSFPLSLYSAALDASTLDSSADRPVNASTRSIWDMTLADCFPAASTFLRNAVFGASSERDMRGREPPLSYDIKQPLLAGPELLRDQGIGGRSSGVRRGKRRAVAVSGTGNGDSFLRTAAARTVCAMMRFSQPVPGVTLEYALRAVAGPGGELQRSAGRRWGGTGEGTGGIIGIEVGIEDDDIDDRCVRQGTVAFDFNCGGMWRAWVEEDGYGNELERVMVFKGEYR